ncbi:MAG TPA: glycoside hydrolase family 3 C-terminal domain-containing protein [Candidatus Coproplasma excrementipullorum]|nr:glycoside hydrolase family 3 C-terminal domain-containing protein [Candidatus Coproplasma excrementipullorum]
MNDRQRIEKLSIEQKAKLLTGTGFWKSAECDDIGLEAFTMSDGPHGLRVQDKMPNHLGIGTSCPSTCFPTAVIMACSWDEELGEELGCYLGAEAAYMGVSMVLGPGLNIKRSPKCGRNFEYFSEDAYLSGKLAAAYVRGIQANGTASCIKHFAVNSRERARMVYDCRVDEQTLRETYLTGFEIAVKEGRPAAVMTAYNKVNGEYCNSSRNLVGDILRGEWGFDGLVVSDWGGTYDKAAAVEAGVDLEMPKCSFSAEEVVRAVKEGRLDEKFVNESVERQLNFSRRVRAADIKDVDWIAHSRFARRCAENSLVLLKNDDNALPLNTTERVALIGDFARNPRYQGAGSSLVNPTFLDNILGAMQNSSLNFVGFAKGFERRGGRNRRLLNGALKLAREADTLVVCLGLGEGMELESCDRTTIDLPRNQIELLLALAELGKKIVVVLSCGGVVDTNWDRYCSALIHAHLAGQSGGGAVVKALTGEINPSGRLAESFPLKEEDVPCHEIYNKYPYKMDFAEGIYVGYKYYNTFGIPVKYPFGYGLSYTTFAYSDACITDDGARVTVTNTGERDGATVVQMYIRAPRPELKDSPAELKGFKKVFLAAGESAQVFIPFDDYSFRTWDIPSAGWREGGEYAVYLGENSANFFFEGRVSRGTAPAFDGQPQTYEQYFESRISPVQPKRKLKKGELTADFMTEIYDLKYCKGFVARLFALISRIYSRSKDELLANSMNHLPIRFILLFLNYREIQAQGFIEACNGHFFKGIKKILFKK